MNRIKLLKERLHTAPDNSYIQKQLATNYTKIGDTHVANGNYDKALWYYEECNRLWKVIVVNLPNDWYKHELAKSYSKLGETHQALGNLDEVIGFYQEYNRLEKELDLHTPKNAAFVGDLALSYIKLGEAYRDIKKDKVTALSNYKQAETLLNQLVRILPEQYQDLLFKVQHHIRVLD